MQGDAIARFDTARRESTGEVFGFGGKPPVCPCLPWKMNAVRVGLVCAWRNNAPIGVVFIGWFSR